MRIKRDGDGLSWSSQGSSIVLAVCTFYSLLAAGVNKSTGQWNNRQFALLEQLDRSKL